LMPDPKKQDRSWPNPKKQDRSWPNPTKRDRNCPTLTKQIPMKRYRMMPIPSRCRWPNPTPSSRSWSCRPNRASWMSWTRKR